MADERSYASGIPAMTQIRRDMRAWGAHFRCHHAAQPGMFHAEVTIGERYIGCTSAMSRDAGIYACWCMAKDEVTHG